MKYLLLAMVLTALSFNSYAGGRCIISFESAGKDHINQKTLSKKNYQEADIMDIEEGDLLASIVNIKHDTAISDENFQFITFTQIIQKTYLSGRDLKLKVIHTKDIATKLTTDEFIALNASDMLALIGKLRVENLPSCTSTN